MGTGYVRQNCSRTLTQVRLVHASLITQVPHQPADRIVGERRDEDEPTRIDTSLQEKIELFAGGGTIVGCNGNARRFLGPGCGTKDFFLPIGKGCSLPGYRLRNVFRGVAVDSTVRLSGDKTKSELDSDLTRGEAGRLRRAEWSSTAGRVGN